MGWESAHGVRLVQVFHLFLVPTTPFNQLARLSFGDRRRHHVSHTLPARSIQKIEVQYV